MQSNATACPHGRAHSAHSTGLALLVLAFLTAVSKAQRFDQFNFTPATNTFPMAHVVTDPVTGAATVVAFNATGVIDTFTWNGTAFVGAGTPSPAGNQGDAMGATAAGLVYFNSLGQTSTRASGGAWSTAAVLTPSSSGRGLAAMTTLVTSNGSAFLFGGNNGTSWINRTPTSGPQPTPRQGATRADDRLGGAVHGHRLIEERRAAGVRPARAGAGVHRRPRLRRARHRRTPTLHTLRPGSARLRPGGRPGSLRLPRSRRVGA